MTSRNGEISELVGQYLESLPDEVAIISRDGTICWTNQKWRAFGEQGGADTDSIGLNYLEVCARSIDAGDGDAESVLEKLRAVATGLVEQVDHTYPCDTPLGRRWFRLVARAVPGHPDHLTVVHQDVTELIDMRAANQLLARQQSTALLVSGLTHDLNNLLQAVIGSLELAAHDGSWDRWVPQAQQAATRSAGLIATVREAAARHVETRRIPFDVIQTLHDVLGIMRSSLDRHARVTTAIPASPIRVESDPVAVEHALINLLVNARDAVKANASTGRHIHVELSTQSGALADVLVSDNGPGVAERDADLIFTPFFTTKGAGGSGLGLFMARNGLVAAGGSLELVHPPVLGGASFRIRLPQATPA